MELGAVVGYSEDYIECKFDARFHSLARERQGIVLSKHSLPNGQARYVVQWFEKMNNTTHSAWELKEKTTPESVVPPIH